MPLRRDLARPSKGISDFGMRSAVQSAMGGNPQWARRGWGIAGVKKLHGGALPRIEGVLYWGEKAKDTRVSPLRPSIGSEGNRAMCSAARKPLIQISSVQAARLLFDACQASGAENKRISALKMQKLVYIAHENHIASTGRPFISDRVEAWSNGPVFPALNQFIGNSREDIVTEACLPTNDCEDPKVEKYIGEIWDRLAKKTGVALSNATHAKGTPWHLAMNPQRNFFQILIGWRPKHPVIDEYLIKRYLRESRAWG